MPFLPLLLAAATAAQDPPPARIERRLALMGTGLTLVVEADDRAAALAASERAVRALEAAEQRLTTWSRGGELARLNEAPAGRWVPLGPTLARELAAARDLWRATGGAFDPGVGGLVQAWGLRTGGRRPTASEIERALAPRGLAALELEGDRARRVHADLVLEEGGFGKGAGLDAAVAALAGTGARRAELDLGGQVAVHGPGRRWIPLAHPDRRETPVLEVALERGSLATSGNSERGRVVEGEPVGHLLDPRHGRPAPDFGSLTVRAPDALTADALSTGLYVLGPDAALAYAAEHDGVEVLVLERGAGGALRARASAGLADALRVLVDDLELERTSTAGPLPQGEPGDLRPTDTPPSPIHR